jgi:hypothetical protein
MRELSLHLLDIAENSVAARATDITIRLVEDLCGDRLFLSVADNGRGMDAHTAESVLDPFVTSRTTRKIGLGIPLLKEAAEACQGGLTLSSTLGQGTRLEAWFQYSHIDRMPLGDLAATLFSLVIAFPDICWLFNCQVDGRKYQFDSRPVVEALDGISITEPEVIKFLRSTIQDGIARIQNETQAA